MPADVDELIKRLRPPEWQERRDAALPLRKLGPKAGDALDSLQETFKSDNERSVAVSALLAIIAIDSKSEVIRTPVWVRAG